MQSVPLSLEVDLARTELLTSKLFVIVSGIIISTARGVTISHRYKWPGRPLISVRPAETTRISEHKRATKKGDLHNKIAEHHLKTSQAID